MKTRHAFACALLCFAALSGCSRPTVHVNRDSVLQHISIQSDRVGAKALDGTMAWIDATGALTIDGNPVELTADQRALASRYQATAIGLRGDGIAVGEAGAAVAGKAVSSVIQGLASGKPDDIGPKIEAEAKNIEAKAMLLCQRVGELQATQDALAASLPAFKPYARMTEHDNIECGRDEDPEAVRTAVRNDIRETIRSTIRNTVRGRSNGGAESPSSALISAADTGDVAAVARLVAEGADVNVRIRGDGTALIRAAAHGDLAVVDELIRLGADVNRASRGDGNPLIAAASAGHQDVVERLLEAGADVDAIVPGDETALINAARHGHLEIVRLLVAKGADVNLGVSADLGRWRSPLNEASDGAVRDFLRSRGAVANDHG